MREEVINVEWSVLERLMAQAIGYEVIKFLKEEGRLETLFQTAESEAVQALEEIRRVLDDDTAEDPNCFWRIERIVTEFESRGLGTARHDW